MAIETARLEAIFTADTKDFDKGVRDVQRGMAGATRRLSANLQSVGSQITGLGGRLTAITAPLAGAFGAAVVSAANFDRAMTNAAAILGNTREEMVGLNAEILRIGGQSLAGPQAVAEAFYDIVSGVADTSLHMDILNQSIALSEAGASSLGGATSALIATMNSYGFAAEDASFVSDVFTRTVGMGVLTMEQLASAMPAVTGMANAMGIELDTLGGYMAFITTQGVTASEASTLLRGAMSAMLNPTANLQKAINELGYETGEAMVASLGLDGALSAIKEYGDGSFSGLITSQEAIRAGLILTDSSAQDFFATYKEGIAGATEAAREIQRNSPAARFEELKSGISALGITIGTALLPALNDLLAGIIPVVTQVVDWIGKNPELVMTIAQVTAGLFGLGVSLMAAGIIIKGVGIAIGVLTMGAQVLAGVLTLGKIAVAGLTTVLGVLLSPVVLITGAIGGLLAVLGSGEGGLIGGFNRAVTAARQLIDMGLLLVLNALNDVSNSPAFVAIREAFTNTFDAVRGIVEGAVATINNIVGGIANGIHDVLASLGLVERRATEVKTFTQAEMRAAQSAVLDMAAMVGGFFGGGGVMPTAPPERALGGPVVGRQTYLVGERGPELFTPMTSGRIIPNNRLAGAGAGGGGVTINNLVLNGVQDPQRLFDELQRVARMRGA